jgi:hypothetical protein
MKLPNIVDDLLLIISRGSIPQSSIFDKRLIIQWITNQRALWLYNEFNKGREFRNNELQILNDVELEIDTESSMLNSLPYGTTLLRSVETLPRTIQFTSRDGIVSIRSQNKQIQRFNYVPREQVPYSGNGMFNKSMIYFFKIDDRLYAKYGPDSLRINIPNTVIVEGIFEDPLEVDEFNGFDDNIRNGISEYPVSMRFVEYIKNAILETNFLKLITAPADMSGDDQHNINTTTSE